MPILTKVKFVTAIKFHYRVLQFFDNLTPLGVTFILLAMVYIRNIGATGWSRVRPKNMTRKMCLVLQMYRNKTLLFFVVRCNKAKPFHMHLVTPSFPLPANGVSELFVLSLFSLCSLFVLSLFSLCSLFVLSLCCILIVWRAHFIAQWMAVFPKPTHLFLLVIKYSISTHRQSRIFKFHLSLVNIELNELYNKVKHEVNIKHNKI